MLRAACNFSAVQFPVGSESGHFGKPDLNVIFLADFIKIAGCSRNGFCGFPCLLFLRILLRCVANLDALAAGLTGFSLLGLFHFLILRFQMLFLFVVHL